MQLAHRPQPETDPAVQWCRQGLVQRLWTPHRLRDLTRHHLSLRCLLPPTRRRRLPGIGTIKITLLSERRPARRLGCLRWVLLQMALESRPTPGRILLISI